MEGVCDKCSTIAFSNFDRIYIKLPLKYMSSDDDDDDIENDVNHQAYVEGIDRSSSTSE